MSDRSKFMGILDRAVGYGVTCYFVVGFLWGHLLFSLVRIWGHALFGSLKNMGLCIIFNNTDIGSPVILVQFFLRGHTLYFSDFPDIYRVVL